MSRLMIMSILCLLSLLNIFRAPLNILWYVSILTTEFGWLFAGAVILLLCFSFGHPKYIWPTHIMGVIALCLFCWPLLQACRISDGLDTAFGKTFPKTIPESHSPFSFSRVLLGIHASSVGSVPITYSIKDSLSLDLYPAQQPGNRPCVIIIHGGSWAGGNSQQLPELNSVLAKRGFQVASINYRLAPVHPYPAPVEDVSAAIAYLRAHGEALHIDTSNFVLLGRSAGGQIALDAAYSIKAPWLRGVISYYAPTDMVWGYANPANPLVLDSKKVMEDYLGGTYAQVPGNYVSSSATETVNHASVPTLLIQGKNDPLVAYDHCNRLDVQLNRHRVPHFVLRLPWATHGCDYTLNGPAGQLCTYVTLRFLQNVCAAQHPVGN